MLPDRCSVAEDGRPCANPPEFIVSIADGDDEYMVGVTCLKHKHVVAAKTGMLQDQGRMRRGTVNFASVRAVGTDCIRGDADDLVQIGARDGTRGCGT